LQCYNHDTKKQVGVCQSVKTVEISRLTLLMTELLQRNSRKRQRLAVPENESETEKSSSTSRFVVSFILKKEQVKPTATDGPGVHYYHLILVDTKDEQSASDEGCKRLWAELCSRSGWDVKAEGDDGMTWRDLGRYVGDAEDEVFEAALDSLQVTRFDLFLQHAMRSPLGCELPVKS
jgi:hypothetical protein